jgi:hypothetical protein
MSKEKLKVDLYERQNGQCALSEEKLEIDPKWFDTDRILPKADGGIYTVDNTRIADPVAHMKRHGNYRERSPQMEAMKEAFDARMQIMKLRNKINNQILAFERRTDALSQETLGFLQEDGERMKKRLAKHDRKVKRLVQAVAETDILARAALGVEGIGEFTVANCLIYIDVEKAPHASSLWKYAGLHASSNDRYKKGKSSGGNKTLRTALYTMATSQEKTRGAYREVYDQAKLRKEQSEKLVKSRNTQGKLVEVKWKDTKPSHRRGHALRIVMKHFLADYWYVARTVQGLETTALYPEAILGGNHRTIMPEERGWEY